jgi:hypothetical protein
MNKRTLLIIARLFFGLLTFYAIGVQFRIHLRLGFNLVNFFSYFTNLSNLFLAFIFITGGLNLWRNRKPTPGQDLARGASVLYIAVVGIVFSILLREVELGALRPWINSLLHYVNPIVGVADWFIDPPKSRISLRDSRVWLVFPLVYLAYALVRGAATGWYPYPFLNPAHVGGYGVVALYCLAILVVFFAFSWVVVRLTRPAKPEGKPKRKSGLRKAKKKAR